MKYAAICLFLICSMAPSLFAAEEPNTFSDPVLGEKMVLCEIDFLPDSYILSEQAKLQLDGIVSKLEQLDTSLKTIRIEGYTGSKDSLKDTSQLSMMRALAVEDYFRIQHEAGFDRYITGHKNAGSECRVKISIYDNPWNVVEEQIQITNRGMTDGPS